MTTGAALHDASVLRVAAIFLECGLLQIQRERRDEVAARAVAASMRFCFRTFDSVGLSIASTGHCSLTRLWGDFRVRKQPVLFSAVLLAISTYDLDLEDVRAQFEKRNVWNAGVVHELCHS